MKRRLEPGQQEQILAAYIAGTPLIEIADRHGIHVSYPVQLARRRGIGQLRNAERVPKRRRRSKG